MISVPYLPVASITIAGLPLAFVLGGITLTFLITTAIFGMLLRREGSDTQLTLHVNLARLTVIIALIHGLVVYLTFF